MSIFLFVASSHFLALLSPGPDFLLLTKTSLRHGKHYAHATVLGISGVNGLYISLALSGTHLLQHSPYLAVAMQWASSAFLLYLGLQFWRSSLTATSYSSDPYKASTAHATWLSCFMQGFVSALLNPKNVLFYLSLANLLPSAENDQGLRVAMGLWMCMVVYLWNTLLIRLLSHSKWQRRLYQLAPYIERSCAMIFITLGLLAAYRVLHPLLLNDML